MSQTPPVPSLDTIVERAAHSAFSRFPKLGTNELAITLISSGKQASYRGDVPLYPASVVKLFYLEAAHRWMEDGKLQDSLELRRAMRDMIVDSYNEATHYVVDALTGTTSGPELPPPEMEQWSLKRNSVNRYFAGRGFERINVNQKPWCEGPYGREREFVGASYNNRNALTTEATARLLNEIVTGKAVSSKRSGEMMELLKRDPFKPSADPDDQSHGFTGQALPAGTGLWSKAGWTSTARHDGAFVRLPGGPEFILVTFTVNHSDDRNIIPAIAESVIAQLRVPK